MSTMIDKDTLFVNGQLQASLLSCDHPLDQVGFFLDR